MAIVDAEEELTILRFHEAGAAIAAIHAAKVIGQDWDIDSNEFVCHRSMVAVEEETP